MGEKSGKESWLSKKNKEPSRNALTAAKMLSKDWPKAYGNAAHARKNSHQAHIILNKMVTYKCFFCGKQIQHTALEKRFVCPGCGKRIFFKPRKKSVKIKAV